MAVKPMNFKMDEADIQEMKKVAGVFNMSVTDLIRQAIKDYITTLKRDPLYRLTASVEDASEEESEEVLSAIEGLTDDDLKITSSKRFTA